MIVTPTLILEKHVELSNGNGAFGTWLDLGKFNKIYLDQEIDVDIKFSTLPGGTDKIEEVCYNGKRIYPIS